MAGEDDPPNDRVQFRSLEYKKRVMREADRRGMSQSDVAEEYFETGLEARDRNQNPEEMETKIAQLEARVEELNREVEDLREDKRELRERLAERKQELTEIDPDSRAPGDVLLAFGGACIILGIAVFGGALVASELGSSPPDFIAAPALLAMVIGAAVVGLGYVVRALPATWQQRLPSPLGG
jgi:TolA-binding protein